jgi:hypothetical protein
VIEIDNEEEEAQVWLVALHVAAFAQISRKKVKAEKRRRKRKRRERRRRRWRRRRRRRRRRRVFTAESDMMKSTA